MRGVQRWMGAAWVAVALVVSASAAGQGEDKERARKDWYDQANALIDSGDPAVQLYFASKSREGAKLAKAYLILVRAAVDLVDGEMSGNAGEVKRAAQTVLFEAALNDTQSYWLQRFIDGDATITALDITSILGVDLGWVKEFIDTIQDVVRYAETAENLYDGDRAGAFETYTGHSASDSQGSSAKSLATELKAKDGEAMEPSEEPPRSRSKVTRFNDGADIETSTGFQGFDNLLDYAELERDDYDEDDASDRATAIARNNIVNPQGTTPDGEVFNRRPDLRAEESDLFGQMADSLADSESFFSPLASCEGDLTYESTTERARVQDGKVCEVAYNWKGEFDIDHTWSSVKPLVLQGGSAGSSIELSGNESYAIRLAGNYAGDCATFTESISVNVSVSGGITRATLSNVTANDEVRIYVNGAQVYEAMTPYDCQPTAFNWSACGGVSPRVNAGTFLGVHDPGGNYIGSMNAACSSAGSSVGPTGFSQCGFANSVCAANGGREGATASGSPPRTPEPPPKCPEDLPEDEECPPAPPFRPDPVCPPGATSADPAPVAPPPTQLCDRMGVTLHLSPQIDLTPYFQSAGPVTITMETVVGNTGVGEAQIDVQFATKPHIFDQGWVIGNSPQDTERAIRALSGYCESEWSEQQFPPMDGNLCTRQNDLYICGNHFDNVPLPNIAQYPTVMRHTHVETDCKVYLNPYCHPGDGDCIEPEEHEVTDNTCGAYANACELVRKECSEGGLDGYGLCYVEDVYYDCGTTHEYEINHPVRDYSRCGNEDLFRCIGEACVSADREAGASAFATVTGVGHVLLFSEYDQCDGQGGQCDRIFVGHNAACNRSGWGLKSCCSTELPAPNNNAESGDFVNRMFAVAEAGEQIKQLEEPAYGNTTAPQGEAGPMGRTDRARRVGAGTAADSDEQRACREDPDCDLRRLRARAFTTTGDEVFGVRREAPALVDTPIDDAQYAQARRAVSQQGARDVGQNMPEEVQEEFILDPDSINQAAPELNTGLVGGNAMFILNSAYLGWDKIFPLFEDLLGCRESEKQLASMRRRNLCVRTHTTTHDWGSRRREHFCCWNSPLAQQMVRRYYCGLNANSASCDRELRGRCGGIPASELPGIVNGDYSQWALELHNAGILNSTNGTELAAKSTRSVAKRAGGPGGLIGTQRFPVTLEEWTGQKGQFGASRAAFGDTSNAVQRARARLSRGDDDELSGAIRDRTYDRFRRGIKDPKATPVPARP